ncbi:hypothetical protein V4U86_11220 [Mycobacterium sp. AMU20-3851]|uniref:hypothetical protein n=1 Tax=Mycobacterium sp. AMU20-3851 TaxID=3122055 RepID=UPI0037540283
MYRPDQQLHREPERMRQFKSVEYDGKPLSFRLSTASCFLKLCRPVTTLDRGQDLVSGMYLPLAYYDALATSVDVRGPKDGIALSYDTVRRYLNNDLFINLVDWLSGRHDKAPRRLGAGRFGGWTFADDCGCGPQRFG